MRFPSSLRCVPAYSAAILFAAVAGVLPLKANPEGESLKHGKAEFRRSGSDLIIDQKDDRIIVDWNSFSIGKGERTIFRQPGERSSAFNRVLLGSRSIIAGELSANGQVILFNPAGVTVTASGVVNVNSLVITTLDLTEEEFLRGGTMTFRGDSAADVTNLGTIHARTGDVFLLGRKVVNAGTIETPQGTVGLGSGTEIVLKPDAEEPLYIKPRANEAKNSVEQTGVIRAAAAQIKATGNPYALAINLDGVLDVKGSRKRPAGRAVVDAGNGRLRVGGQTRVTALAADGAGGKVALAGQSVSVERGARVEVSGAQGGEITAQAATDLSLSGSLAARGEIGRGGTISLLGADLALTSDFSADSSGHTGGGRIFVGGDYFGGRDSSRRYADVQLSTAKTLRVESGARLTADSLSAGNGGVVIQWADGITLSDATVSVRGGAQSGDGGFAEISGLSGLGFDGRVDLAAPNGRAGEVLFDPDQLNVSNQVPGSADGSLPTINSGVGVQTVSVQALESITSGTITLKASGSGGLGVLFTDLTVNGDGSIDLQPNVSLSVISDQHIIRFDNPQNSIIARGTGSILLQAGTLNLTSSLQSIGNLQTDTGSITLRGDDGVNLVGKITTNGGSVDIDADWDQGTGGGFELPAGSAITTNGGDVHLKSGNGGITVNSPISLGAGRLTFSQTGGASGTFRLGAVISVSGDLDVTQPLQINSGAGLTASGAIHLGSSVTFNDDASLALRSTSLDLTGASFVSPNRADLILEPYDAASNILVNGTDGPGGAYDVSSSLLTSLQVFRSLTIGRMDGTGEITLAADVNTSIPLTLQAGGLGGQLTLDHHISGGANAPLTVAVASDLTIRSGGSLFSQATGTAVTLSAGRFLNGNGANAVAAPNGRWLIYSASPTQNTFDGLASGQTGLWGRNIATAPPATITASGNRYIFAEQPVLEFDAENVTKTYGDDISASLNAAYVSGLVTNTYGGAILPDSLATAYSGTFALSSLGETAAAGVGNYAINLAQGTAQSAPGYAFLLSNGLLSVTAKAIDLTVTSGVSVYGDQPGPTPVIIATGFVNGDTFADLGGIGVDFPIDTRTNAGVYPIGVTGSILNPNYVFGTVTPGAWLVGPRSITLSIVGGSSTYGNVPRGPTLSATGLVNGDTLADVPGVGSNFALTRKSEAGTYLLSVTGQSLNPNYIVVQGGVGEWVIRPRPITVTALGGTSSTGQQPANPGIAVSGLAQGDRTSDLPGLQNSFAVDPNTPAGRYTVNVTGALTNPNYEVTKRIPGLWTVTAVNPVPEPITPSPEKPLAPVIFESPTRSMETASLESSASQLADSAENSSTAPQPSAPPTSEATADALAGENPSAVITKLSSVYSLEAGPVESRSEAPASEAAPTIVAPTAPPANEATQSAEAVVASTAGDANDSAAAPSSTEVTSTVADGPASSVTSASSSTTTVAASESASAGGSGTGGVGAAAVGNVGSPAGRTLGRSVALQSLGEPELGAESSTGLGSSGLARAEQSREVQSVAPLGDFNTVFILVLGIAIAQLAVSAAGGATTSTARPK